MDASGGVLVRFVTNFPPFTHLTRCVLGYNTGEVAGFEPLIAGLLVKRRVAVYAGPGQEAPSDDGARHEPPEQREEPSPPDPYRRKLPGLF